MNTIFEGYDAAVNESMRRRWKVSNCKTGDSCWCRLIDVEDPVLFTDQGSTYHADYTCDQIDNIISAGCISKSYAEYIVNLHNNSL